MVIKLTIAQVLTPFLKRPKEKLHLADISRELDEPHPTVRQWLAYFEEQGILKKSYQGRLTLFSLNIESSQIIDYLSIAEKANLIEASKKSVLLKELIFLLHKYLPEHAAALIFGAAVESVKNAQDIDLLVTGLANKKELQTLLDRLNKQVHLIETSSLQKISLALKEETIKKHLIIKGTEDIVKWMVW